MKNPSEKEEFDSLLKKNIVWFTLIIIVTTITSTIAVISWLNTQIDNRFTALATEKKFVNEADVEKAIDDQIRSSIRAEGIIRKEYNPKLENFEKITSENSINIKTLESNLQSVEPFPIGMVIFLPGNMNTDSGWRISDGTLLRPGEYSEELAAMIGKDANGNVQLPNLKNRAIFGADGKPSSVGPREGTKLTLDSSDLYAGITHTGGIWYLSEKTVPTWTPNGIVRNDNGGNDLNRSSEGVAILGKIKVTSGDAIYPPGYGLNPYIKVK